jgi:hypothetical protein
MKDSFFLSFRRGTRRNLNLFNRFLTFVPQVRKDSVDEACCHQLIMPNNFGWLLAMTVSSQPGKEFEYESHLDCIALLAMTHSAV